MATNEMLSAIFRDYPDLADRLQIEKVYYDKQKRHATVLLLSDEPIGETVFLGIRKTLMKLLPGIRVSLRTAAPSAAQEMLEEPSEYSEIFCALLKRKHPAVSSWVQEIKWLAEKDAIVLEMPDEFALAYMRANSAQDVIVTAIYDIFRVKPPVVLRLRDDVQERMRRIEETRDREQEKRQESAPAQHSEGTKQGAGKKKKAESGRILGRVIKDACVDIGTLSESSGTVCVQGKVLAVERKDIKGKEMVLMSFILNDSTGSIKCKIFLRYRRWMGKNGGEAAAPTQEEVAVVEKVIKQIRSGEGIKVRGSVERDSFDKDIVLMVKDLMGHALIKREDKSESKRIELHAHTQMSNMDATVSARDLISRAAGWGHEAVAITDSGVVQAYPDAFAAAKEFGIKLLPGMEAYMIDQGSAVNNADGRSLDAPVVALDVETTGLNTRQDRIIEVGAVRIKGGEIIETFESMVNPGVPLPQEIIRITGITDQMLIDAPSVAQVLPRLMDFIGDCPVAAHNAKFDGGMLNSELARIGRQYDAPLIDTLVMAQKLYPSLSRYRLASVCKHLGVSLKNAHRAVHDAKATAECLAIMLHQLKERGIETLDDIDKTVSGYAKTNRMHVVLLAVSQQGIHNINKLVSLSHLEYFNRVPTIPRDLIKKHREGLLIGSACEEGEIFQAVLERENPEALKKKVAFYDYLEVQPNGNHAILLHGSMVKDERELEKINKDIVRLGDMYDKPVVATGDVHFLEPEESVYRSVLQFKQNIRTYDVQPTLHFRTTEEMLAEFAFLGDEKAKEIVIDNPKKIAALAGEMSLYPRHPENKTTFSPVWDTAADDIRAMATNRAHELYGDALPELVDKRLQKELTAIIGYGYATLYSIAHMLVLKSLENGYLVGSRGSVGSSFVATLCEITEVNPLPAHYRCSVCRMAHFDVPKQYKVGVDLPPKKCEICGEDMVRDGFDIPFEVFLGFKGDKVPDIDLNFSGEYQARAHAYVEELFGKGYVFRAGTIGTLQEKTAYGLVLKYLEETNKQASNAEIARLAQGCVGVKRTTGQHPGGIVVLPKGYDIAQFTAVQHPADDQDKGTVTTHYDFNSMHDILVKLDILGHDDPTIIHYLEQLTGIRYRDIPLNDQKVMSLFTSPEALSVSAEQIGCDTGTLGVPEFGTSFVRQMLADTKPVTMEELVRISGLSHGTDVWLGNAKDLILSGTAQLKDCICIRDDIMNYLISVGMPAKEAFDIMENVRKGKKLQPGMRMENAMKENGVPQWFIESCRKIGYLFPKGHAVAYVTMALRIAWFKVYYPLEYYAAYFSVRAVGFDSATMIAPPHYLRQMLEELSAIDAKDQKGKEKDEIIALEVVLEMNARGYQFLPVDLYKSDVDKFVIEGSALRSPFTSLSGFGVAAAESIVETRDKPFLSLEDLKNRTKANTSVIESLKACGALNGIADSNQMSFF